MLFPSKKIHLILIFMHNAGIIYIYVHMGRITLISRILGILNLLKLL